MDEFSDRVDLVSLNVLLFTGVRSETRETIGTFGAFKPTSASAAVWKPASSTTLEHRPRRKDLKHTMPNAGGMVLRPNWPLSRDGVVPKSLAYEYAGLGG
jgi:hypothetical protein